MTFFDLKKSDLTECLKDLFGNNSLKIYDSEIEVFMGSNNGLMFYLILDYDSKTISIYDNNGKPYNIGPYLENLKKFKKDYIMKEDELVEHFINLDISNSDLIKNLKQKIDPNRKLKIFTYGIKRLSNYDKPKNTSFDAQIIRSYFAPDISTKKSTGLDEGVQNGVFASDQFEGFLTSIIDKIESDNLVSISIYCTFGRHRSVSTAEILKKYLYPKSIVKHLTINK